MTVGGWPFEEHPLVSRLLKGVGNLKPSLLRYEEIWDPKRLLEHLQSWGQTGQLSMDKLNRLMACLFLLATGQRLQALGLMNCGDFKWGEGSCTICYTTKIKSNDPGRNLTNVQGI